MSSYLSQCLEVSPTVPDAARHPTVATGVPLLKVEFDVFLKATFAKRLYDGTDGKIPPSIWEIVYDDARGLRDMVALLSPDAVWLCTSASDAFVVHSDSPSRDSPTRDQPARAPQQQRNRNGPGGRPWMSGRRGPNNNNSTNNNKNSKGNQAVQQPRSGPTGDNRPPPNMNLIQHPGLGDAFAGADFGQKDERPAPDAFSDEEPGEIHPNDDRYGPAPSAPEQIHSYGASGNQDWEANRPHIPSPRRDHGQPMPGYDSYSYEPEAR
jgi:hypothetical protein